MPCGCDSEFAPVTSINGKMYRNKCVANCWGVEALSMGPQQTGPAEENSYVPQEIPEFL